MGLRDTLKEHSGTVSVIALVASFASAAFSGCTLYFNFLSAPTVTAAVADVIFLNSKPFIGMNVTLRNSGATEAVITRGTLLYDQKEFNLLMEATERDLVSYGPTASETPAKYAYFSPIILGKDESKSIDVLFEADAAGAKIFNEAVHTFTLRMFNGARKEPVAQQAFNVTLTADHSSKIYQFPKASLPVHVSR
jgi:hypothetical protein